MAKSSIIWLADRDWSMFARQNLTHRDSLFAPYIPSLLPFNLLKISIYSLFRISHWAISRKRSVQAHNSAQQLGSLMDRARTANFRSCVAPTTILKFDPTLWHYLIVEARRETSLTSCQQQDELVKPKSPKISVPSVDPELVSWRLLIGDCN